jgi:hypothetical protein
MFLFPFYYKMFSVNKKKALTNQSLYPIFMYTTSLQFLHTNAEVPSPQFLNSKFSNGLSVLISSTFPHLHISFVNITPICQAIIARFIKDGKVISPWAQ